MSYNLTEIGAGSSGMLGFIQGVDTVLMFGWLGTLFLIGLSIVMLSSFMWVTNDSSKSIAATSFLIFSLSILFRAMSLISNRILFVIFIVCAGAIALIWPRE